MVLNLNEDGLALNYSALADGWLLPNGTAWGESVLLCLHLPALAIQLRIGLIQERKKASGKLALSASPCFAYTNSTASAFL